MNTDLTSLKPALVWKHFAAMTQIPRPSFHEEKIRRYVLDVARSLGLECREDAAHNVYVRKPASKGMENRAAIIDECTTGDLCTDPEGRWAALYEAEQIVLEQAVIFPLYGQCNAEMVSSAVTGVAFHPVALNRVYKNAAKSE